MAVDGKNSSPARKKRIRRLKHLIILMMFTMILMPTVCCVALILQVSTLNSRIDALIERLTIIEQSKGTQSPMSYNEYGPYRLRADVVDGDIQQAGALPQQTEDWNAYGAEDESSNELEYNHKIYLTFDDGPSIYTDEILDILAEYDVKATFFVVGKEDESSQNAIKRIVEEGHTLGMHSYSHKYSELYASLDNFEEDFQKQRNYLEELTGQSCKFYRFPGGSSNTVSKVDMHLFMDYLDSQDMVFYDWNVSSGDGGKPLLSVETLVKNSTADVEQWHTAVILMHDSAEKRTTVDALPKIIEKFLEMEDTVILPITEDTVPIQHIY